MRLIRLFFSSLHVRALCLLNCSAGFGGFGGFGFVLWQMLKLLLTVFRSIVRCSLGKYRYCCC